MCSYNFVLYSSEMSSISSSTVHGKMVLVILFFLCVIYKWVYSFQRLSSRTDRLLRMCTSRFINRWCHVLLEAVASTNYQCGPSFTRAHRWNFPTWTRSRWWCQTRTFQKVHLQPRINHSRPCSPPVLTTISEKTLCSQNSATPSRCISFLNLN